jgi:hypothetical protein
LGRITRIIEHIERQLQFSPINEMIRFEIAQTRVSIVMESLEARLTHERWIHWHTIALCHNIPERKEYWFK